MRREDPIGIFDSGAGGVSVLRTALSMLPEEHFIYYGDSANAPYGTKTETEVIACAERVMQLLLDRGCKAIVIACNTATCAAAAYLREKYADLIIIGMEPALKLAHDQCPGGRIAVLATPLSLASAKYHMLYEKYGENSVSVPCPGLMEMVEKGDTDSETVKGYLRSRLEEVNDGEGLAAVVLGCTHYVFLKNAVREVAGEGVSVLDGNEGTVRQLERRLKARELDAKALPDTATRCEILSSGGENDIAVMKKLLKSE